jgi:hypothetical protein
MFHRSVVVILACMLFLAGQSLVQSSGFELPKAGIFILGIDQGKALLKQCSRSVPTKVSGYWEPSTDDIAKLEEQLPSYIRDGASKKKSIPNNIAYHRQYLGIIVDDKSLIYGNFYPSDMPNRRNEQLNPVVVCDGGHSFWGIVFDPTTGQFEEPQLNGFG